jgi:two-component system, NtrC family, response regulator AtoC
MKILVVDDEAPQRQMLTGFLKKQGYDVYEAGGGEEALQIFGNHPIQLVLLDHRMGDLTGDEVLACIKKIDPLARTIMITAYGNVETAVNVMKLGADDFMEKPINLSNLLEKIQMIEQCLVTDSEAAEVDRTITTEALPVKIVGNSSAVKEVLSLAKRFAPTPWTVLIRGETGTGKELVARLIHLLSSVADGPFVEVNCSAIPENLFESELFGHEKGAFTSADKDRKGRFELAHGGSLFLDEIGELPLALQPKLLRAIQDKTFTRVGGEMEFDVNVRVIAATNRDLKKQTEDGFFREDLYYRLKVLDIELPPLRNRKEDIPELIDFFLKRYTQQALQFDADATATLMKYAFPGNVRELEHIIQRTITLVRGSVIRARDLPPEIRYQQAATGGRLSERLSTVEQEMIYAALENADWVQTRAAESLGISERVLRYKMTKYGIKKSG